MAELSITEKSCSRCKATKPIVAFCRDARRRYGLTAWCKACISIKCKEYYAKNKRQPESSEYLKVSHLSLKEIVRLFSKIAISPNVQWNGTPCWVWIAGTRRGYSRIHWKRNGIPAHRLMYAWLIAPIPNRKIGELTDQLDHLCRNPLCCNPIHLELVSPRVNTLRSNAASAVSARKTHCKYGHEFTPENIRRLSTHPNSRRCAICTDRNNKKAYEHRKAMQSA
jgi:hypothetical protein